MANGLTATLFGLKDLKIPNAVEEHSYDERQRPPEKHLAIHKEDAMTSILPMLKMQAR